MVGIEESLIALAGAGNAAASSAAFRARLHALAEAADDRGPIAQECPGTRNQRLLRLHARLTDERLEACARCPDCAERNEFDVPVAGLLAAPPGDRDARIAVGASIFRLPRMADLDAIATGPDAEPIAWQLARCCRIEGTEPVGADLVEALGAAFDDADPAAAITIGLACAACGHDFRVSIDVALLVGEAAVRAADGLLRDIDTIAGGYGWSEAQILALPLERRRRYVAMIAARRGAGGAPARLVGRSA